MASVVTINIHPLAAPLLVLTPLLISIAVLTVNQTLNVYLKMIIVTLLIVATVAFIFSFSTAFKPVKMYSNPHPL